MGGAAAVVVVAGAGAGVFVGAAGGAGVCDGEGGTLPVVLDGRGASTAALIGLSVNI